MEDEATVEQDIIFKVYTKGINPLKDKILLGLSNSYLSIYTHKPQVEL